MVFVNIFSFETAPETECAIVAGFIARFVNIFIFYEEDITVRNIGLSVEPLLLTLHFM